MELLVAVLSLRNWNELGRMKFVLGTQSASIPGIRDLALAAANELNCHRPSSYGFPNWAAFNLLQLGWR
jgi:hypothetical protein